MAKAKLNDEVKAYIVQGAGLFRQPVSCRNSSQEGLRARCEPEAGRELRPNKKAASGLAPKWRPLYEGIRKAFHEDVASIAIRHRAVRHRAGVSFPEPKHHPDQS